MGMAAAAAYVVAAAPVTDGVMFSELNWTAESQ